VLQDFHQKYPWISIQHTGGKSDQDIYRAVNSNTAPDMMISPGPDNVAKFCSGNTYTDLSTYLQTDGIDVSTIIPDAALRYTSYNGNQCSLPVLSDAYGMYYNTDMFQKAGISSPPKTLSELQADAKKLTVLNPDGSIKIAGFVPLQGSTRATRSTWVRTAAARGTTRTANSAFASDPTWASLLQWQQQFITDVYGPDGYHKLQEFFSKLVARIPNGRAPTGSRRAGRDDDGRRMAERVHHGRRLPTCRTRRRRSRSWTTSRSCTGLV
jgi:multiple sugar transport system substrate-binding protein